jgi:arylsulfatase
MDKPTCFCSSSWIYSRSAFQYFVDVGEDFGWSDIGAFGAEISTPNLEQLTREGKIGINYHTAPTCSPVMAAMLTGMDWHVGGLGNMYELIAQNQVGEPDF